MVASTRVGTEKGRRTTESTRRLLNLESARRAEYNHTSTPETKERVKQAYDATNQRLSDRVAGRVKNDTLGEADYSRPPMSKKW